MKKLVLVLVLIFTVNFSFAQNSDKAKALLDEVYNKVQGYENIFVDFNYVLHNAEADINSETRGDVTLKNDKYLFNYLGTLLIQMQKSKVFLWE